MPFTSPKMSLRVWNLLTDQYDHDQLADNWMRVDQHDHTPGRGVQIPTEGLADGAVTAPKLASDIALDLTGYRNITNWQGGAQSFSGVGPATFALANPITNAASAVNLADTFWLDPVLLSTLGPASFYRVLSVLVTNQIAQTNNILISLHPVTPTYGALNTDNTYTIGAAVTNSAATHVAAPASSTLAQVSADFAPPAAGLYCLGITYTGGGTAAGSRIAARGVVQGRG